ncbi:MAG: GEVED domain-containing protein, partial [Saprospiraceae bacterium]|nr:GEVED domain-containing protein [Saprospiraceae bacterium]
TITVLDPNAYAPPVAGTDVGMTFQSNPLTLRTLANDFSGRVGTSLVPGSVQITVQPAHGTVSVDPVTGDITYTPNPGYIGPDSYMYSISDNLSPTPGTAQGSQFIQVISPNSANSVLAANDQVCAGAGSLFTGNVLTNDIDPEGDAIQTVPMQMTTAEYTFTLDAAGNFSFVSSPSFNDVVTVEYIVIDNNPAEERDTAVLSIYIKNILGDRVWEDANFNGLLDAGEEGVGNVKVTLHTCSGNMPGAAIPGSLVQSDENGYYLLPLPANGSYALKFDISMAGNSGGYSFTVPDASNNSSDSQDSDVDPITGYTACFSVTGSASLPQLDAGVYSDSDGDQYPDVVDGSPLPERLGYIYCEQTGEILTGGKISVSGPAPATILHDGSEGFYQILTSVDGEYEITLTPPPGFDTAFQCLPQATSAFGIKYVFELIDDYGDGWNDAYMEVKQGDTVIAVLGGGIFNDDGEVFFDTLLLQPNTNYTLYYANGGDYPEEVAIKIYNDIGLLIHTTNVGTGIPGNTLFSWETGGVISFGSSNTDGNPDYLDDSACENNPYSLKLQLGPGVFVTNNNLVVSCLDFGDNPLEYNTLLEDDGPRHKLYQQPLLYLGEKVDAETEGQPDAMAGIMGGGDDGDTATRDDEDGLSSIPVVIPGSDLSLVYKATNASTATAFVKVFVDFNHDFDFTDPGETQTAEIPAGSAGAMDTLVLSAPLQIPNGDKIGVRLRMSLNSDMAFTGEEEEGEVEDYALLISGYDFGDLPSSYINAGSPPYHIINSKLMLGNSVDSELSGFTGSAATGDDGDSGQATLGVAAPGGDDENGVMLATPMTPGSVATFMVNAINLTGSPAVLQAWVDFNTDGDFDPDEELTTGDFASGGAVVPVGGLNGAKLDFNVPAAAVFSVGLANIRFRLSPDGELSPDSHSGTAPFGEIEDYSFLTDGNDYDYGDLPDTYNTSGNDNPPRHIVEDSLKLGASLDSDTDGQPDSKAGLLSGGDDDNAGEVTFGTPGSEGDDEDGIQFFGMLVPGTTAVVVVDAMNMTGEPAVLQGWIDFNSNGAFETGEELTTGDFAPGGAGLAVPNGGLSGKKLTFVVPQGATFPNGLAMARFRLSPDGGLDGDSQTGLAPIGEIEDYAFPLAKIGNLAWIDRDNDGIQEADEPGLDSVKVTLIWAGPDGIMDTEGDNEMQMVITGQTGGFDEGEYYFSNIGPGQYKLLFEAPASFVVTAPNRGAQWQGGQKDSDAVAMGMNVHMVMERAFTIGNPLQQPTSEGGNGDNGVNPSGGTPDNQTDETHDAGFWNPCCSDLLKYCCPTQNK